MKYSYYQKGHHFHMFCTKHHILCTIQYFNLYICAHYTLCKKIYLHIQYMKHHRVYIQIILCLYITLCHNHLRIFGLQYLVRGKVGRFCICCLMYRFRMLSNLCCMANIARRTYLSISHLHIWYIRQNCCILNKKFNKAYILVVFCLYINLSCIK